MKKHSGRLLFTFFFLSFSMTVFSCGKVKRAEVQLLGKQHDLIGNAADKDALTYHSSTPDTDDNKQRFREHLETAVTPDVKELFTYGHVMGIDNSVLMSFTCEQSTINRIIRKNGMELCTDTTDKGLYITGCPQWWNRDAIENLVPYKAGEEDGFWQYLWYNPVTKQAFYEEFSM